jgi:hypothetical protein
VSPSEATIPEVDPSGHGLSGIERAASRYLDAARGDRDEALRLVIADLLRSEDETAVAVAALDRWISYGYVRGRATDTLRRRSRPPDG